MLLALLLCSRNSSDENASTFPYQRNDTANGCTVRVPRRFVTDGESARPVSLVSRMLPGGRFQKISRKNRASRSLCSLSRARSLACESRCAPCDFFARFGPTLRLRTRLYILCTQMYIARVEVHTTCDRSPLSPRRDDRQRRLVKTKRPFAPLLVRRIRAKVSLSVLFSDLTAPLPSYTRQRLFRISASSADRIGRSERYTIANRRQTVLCRTRFP